MDVPSGIPAPKAGIVLREEVMSGNVVTAVYWQDVNGSIGASQPICYFTAADNHIELNRGLFPYGPVELDGTNRIRVNL